MKLMFKLTGKLCKTFGHKWNYYKIDSRQFRVCRRCHDLQYWTDSYTPQNYIWVSAVGYTELGAKSLEGYGK